MSKYDLTNEQYIRLLFKIKERVNEPNFMPRCYSSTEIGDKDTQSNCGMCNDEFTDEDMALFPDQYPKRKSMKYKGEGHKCPFDWREGTESWGCFYTCYLFQEGLRDINKIKELVNNRIEYAKLKFGEKKV